MGLNMWTTCGCSNWIWDNERLAQVEVSALLIQTSSNCPPIHVYQTTLSMAWLMHSTLESQNLITQTTTSSIAPFSLPRTMQLMTSINPFSIASQVKRQSWHLLIKSPTTWHKFTPSSSCIQSRDQAFLWPTLLWSLVVHSCFSAISMSPMVFAMAHVWYCWRSNSVFWDAAY